ncbi:hypothetical protein L6452_00205 [Arctium lappa]|uniref:Uncharacterized protein n=1 Tax=Arctium lappa TaxID=4217 RepID=A0ACB9FEN6_ARCLA|nr:hypothetical protein L6452_00205 [Arctium lappa]
MIATVTPPIAGNSLRFPPLNSTGSTSKSFSGCSHTCKPSFHAVLTARRPESLYEVLRVGKSATTMEIKKAYWSLAKVYHPDASDFNRHGGDRDFVEIHEAYETLSDPEARATYDLKWSSVLRRRSGLYSAVVGRSPVFYAGRRWETDQCW